MPRIDGPNLVIHLDSAVTSYDAGPDIYSVWKEWARGHYLFNTETAVNGSTEVITNTLDGVNHSLYVGQRVTYHNLGGIENIGLTDGSEYFVRPILNSTFELYDTKVNAEGSPSTTGRLNLTASGAGLGETHLLISDSSKFLPAFDTTGGDSLGDNEFISGFFFLRNDIGWRLQGPNEAIEITINGDIFPRDALTAFFNFSNDFITRKLSAKSLVRESGVSGLTAEESAALSEIKGRLGLDVSFPLTITDNSITFGGVTITIAQPDADTTTVTRQP